MTFLKLSDYFEKLEATSPRFLLIDILSDLLKHASKEDVLRLFSKIGDVGKDVGKVARVLVKRV